MPGTTNLESKYLKRSFDLSFFPLAASINLHKTHYFEASVSFYGGNSTQDNAQLRKQKQNKFVQSAAKILLPETLGRALVAICVRFKIKNRRERKRKRGSGGNETL
jgi:hypothetical protein